MFHAELAVEIAIVGVKPPLSCSGPSCGSAVATTPRQLSLFSIRLPAPLPVIEKPAKAHSSEPLLEMIVLLSVKNVDASGSVWIKTTPPPDPELSLPLIVALSTDKWPLREKTAPPASALPGIGR